MIDMAGWVNGDKVIRCQCGRKLDANSGVFGFGLSTANCAWARYMRQEISFIKGGTNGPDIRQG
jgi:hypothetical protein